MKKVRILGLTMQKKKEFTKLQEEVLESQQKMEILGQWNVKVDSVLVQFLIMCIYILGATMIFDFKLSVGGIFAFITYRTFVTTPITAILNIGYLLAGVIPSTIRYYQFMELPEEMNKETVNNFSKEGEIEFYNVSFSYDRKKNIFTNINLKITDKSKVGIIGENGSEKSTLLDIIL